MLTDKHIFHTVSVGESNIIFFNSQGIFLPNNLAWKIEISLFSKTHDVYLSTSLSSWWQIDLLLPIFPLSTLLTEISCSVSVFKKRYDYSFCNNL